MIEKIENEWNIQFVLSWSAAWDQYSDWMRNSVKLYSSPFYSRTSIDAWVAAYGGEDNIRPYFIFAELNNSIRIIFPLVSVRSCWKQAYIIKIRPIGEREFDYHDPILLSKSKYFLIPDEFWDALSRKLGNKTIFNFDSLHIPRVRKNLLAGVMAGRQLTDKSPFVRLEKYDSPDSFLASRKKSLRVDVKRQIKRLSTQGEVAFRVYDDVDETLEWLPDLEAAREKKYPGSNLKSGYLYHLIKEGLGSNIHCSAILLDGEAISWHVGFYDEQNYYWYIPVYNSDFQNYSPGKIHIYYAIGWAIEQKIPVFDFLRGDESYKMGWTNGERYEMTDYEYINTSVISRLRNVLSGYLVKLGYLRVWMGS